MKRVTPKAVMARMAARQRRPTHPPHVILTQQHWITVSSSSTSGRGSPPSAMALHKSLHKLFSEGRPDLSLDRTLYLMLEES